MRQKYVNKKMMAKIDDIVSSFFSKQYLFFFYNKLCLILNNPKYPFLKPFPARLPRIRLVLPSYLNIFKSGAFVAAVAACYASG